MKQSTIFPVAFTMTMLALLLLTSFGPKSCAAQVRIEVQRGGQGVIEVRQGIALGMGFESEDDEEIAEENKKLAAGGATLKTDPNLEILLEKANRRREDGNYRAATQMWQAVLERSGDALFSADEVIYLSLVNRVERIIATLPEEGLAIYRITADAEAKEILASAGDPNDLAALNQVVRRFFVSSVGDDAAFRLGCIYLDNYDFPGALRMFDKIVRYYPDPSVPLNEVHARIALCHSFMGNTEQANVSIATAKEVDGSEFSSAIESIETSVGNISVDSSAADVSNEWAMQGGNLKRNGAMAALPKSAYSSDQEAVWQFYVPPRDSRYGSVADTIGVVLTGDESHGKTAKNTRNIIEKKLIESWTKNSWRPAGHLLFDQDRIYFKAPADIVAWDRKKIEDHIRDKSEKDVTGIDDFVAWRSVWRNAFQIDESSMMLQTIRRSWGAFNRRRGSSKADFPYPNSFAEVQLFGDTIYQEMSFHDGILYAIEGKRFDDRNREALRSVQPQWNASVRRTRVNYLTAYDQKTGSMLWSVPQPETKKKNAETEEVDVEDFDEVTLKGAGFMAAPIGFGELVIAPVNMGGAIHLFAFDRQGNTVWNAFLCDEPESGSVPWSPINLTLDGSDLFVNCGMGVIFVIDPTSGMVRFAKRYKREGEKDEFTRRNNWTNERLEFDGWSSDVIVPYGNQLICFCSDTKTIRAFDRNSGKVLWGSTMKPDGHQVDYIIGAYNDILYLGGKSTIIAIDLKGEGMLAWGSDDLFDGKTSHGRGMVTPNGVFVPVENAIYRFNLTNIGRDKQALDKFEVFLGTSAPVGNLYSDGNRIWVHGGNRVYALGPRE